MTNNNYENQIPHYYGDIVRLLFLFGGLIMFVGLPLILDYIKIPSTLAIVGILIITIAAGLTNPKLKWDAGINTLVSSLGFLTFGIYAVSFYKDYGLESKVFLTNLLLGTIFLIAVYFSTKTLRGLLLK